MSRLTHPLSLTLSPCSIPLNRTSHRGEGSVIPSPRCAFVRSHLNRIRGEGFGERVRERGTYARGRTMSRLTHPLSLTLPRARSRSIDDPTGEGEVREPSPPRQLAQLLEQLHITDPLGDVRKSVSHSPPAQLLDVIKQLRVRSQRREHLEQQRVLSEARQ